MNGFGIGEVTMNERIKELAEQAGIAVWGDAVYMYNPKDTLDSTVMEKFAKLIIQKCFQVCMNEGASYEEKAAGAYQSNLYVTAIKQHFGVEE